MTDLTGPPWPSPADPFPAPTPTGPCVVPAELHDQTCPGRGAAWHDPVTGRAGCPQCGAVITAERWGWAA